MYAELRCNRITSIEQYISPIQITEYVRERHWVLCKLICRNRSFFGSRSNRNWTFAITLSPNRSDYFDAKLLAVNMNMILASKL